MAQSMEQIRQLIKSVDVSYKITKAMQLVATAKLKRVGRRIENIKPYYVEVYNTFHQLLPKLDNSIYIKNQTSKSDRTLWVVFNSNLGLCGGFNNNLNKVVLENFHQDDQLITIGTKGTSFFKNHHKKIINSYYDYNTDSSYQDSQEITLSLISLFNTGQIDAIKVAYTKYVNSVTMVPTVIDLLPIISKQNNEQEVKILADFEPNPQSVIETAIPLYIGAIIYGALVESQVSEQASRRLAMENASNNANEMKNNLLISYNRARQGAITQEISEIIGGADAQDS